MFRIEIACTRGMMWSEDYMKYVILDTERANGLEEDVDGK